MASAFAPTACTYAGIAPRAKQDAPSMNSEAMAEFRRAGFARTLTQRPEHAECVRGAAYGLGVDRLQVVTPVRSSTDSAGRLGVACWRFFLNT